MKRRPWISGTGAAAAVAAITLGLGIAPAHAQNTTGISAMVNPDGRVVFTNLAAPAPRAAVSNPPPAATIGPRTVQISGQSARYDELIELLGRQHGVDPHLVRAVIQAESSFDRTAVSSKGARGLMQLMPATGSRFGVRDFFDPAQNIEGGVRYLRVLLEMFGGDLELTLAAYNSGENRVARIGRVPDIAETQNYVRKVRDLYRALAGTVQQANRTQQSPANAARNRPPTAAGPAPASPAPSAISRSIDARGVLTFTNLATNRQVP